MATKVRVPKNGLAVMGWKGLMEIDGDVLRVLGEDPQNRLDIDCSQVKRGSFNSSNGVCPFRMKDGKKLYLQTSGMILSADRSVESRAATDTIGRLLAQHGVRNLSI